MDALRYQDFVNYILAIDEHYKALRKRDEAQAKAFGG